MPRIVDKEERHRALVSAALRVFAEHGYHRATMQTVADAAGVSKGSLYDYFDSKEQLLLATAETLLTVLLEESMVLLERSDRPLAERIEICAAKILEGVEQWAEVGLSILQVWAELGCGEEGPLRTLMSDLYGRSADRIQGVFDDAVGKGEVPPFPTRAAALSILAALDGMLLQSIVAPEEYRQGLRSGLFPRWCGSIISAATEHALQ